MPIPANHEDLTVEWLTEALRKTDTINQARVISFLVKPVDEGKGWVGQLVRLSLDYDAYQENAPRTMIAKFSSADPNIRLNFSYGYQTEVGFYEHIAPLVDLRTARCYYGEVDSESGEHVLLLEDLAPAQSGQRASGCSLEQAERAIREIAKFHSSLWESPHIKVLNWLPEFDLPQFQQRQDSYQQLWQTFLHKVGHQLPASILMIGERFREHYVSVANCLFQTPPRTFIHYDYQLNNILYPTSEGGSPFAVIDWQLARCGRGVLDVAYFLGQNLHPEDRRAVEIDLLRLYHDDLLACGVQNYTFEQCLHDYRLSMLYWLSGFVLTVGGGWFTAEQEHELTTIVMTRNIAAILDLDAGQLLPY